MTEFPTLGEFRAWLEAKPKDAVVATDWNWETCPLACLLKDRGAPSPRVGALGTWEVSANDPVGVLPDWAREFIYWVDQSAKPRTITAEECLFILDSRSFEPERWDGGVGLMKYRRRA